jgi:hypothetical protein
VLKRKDVIHLDGFTQPTLDQTVAAQRLLAQLSMADRHPAMASGPLLYPQWWGGRHGSDYEPRHLVVWYMARTNPTSAFFTMFSHVKSPKLLICISFFTYFIYFIELNKIRKNRII